MIIGIDVKRRKRNRNTGTLPPSRVNIHWASRGLRVPVFLFLILFPVPLSLRSSLVNP